MTSEEEDPALDRRVVFALAGIAAGAFTLSAMKRLRRRHRLDDKVVLITGGSRGLGLLMARRCAEKGARLVICARDRDELARAQADLEARGAEVCAVRCDVRSPQQVARLVAQAIETFGGVDVLINNAGIIQVGPLESMTRKDFADAMDVNFWGTVHPTRALLPHLKARRGRIVNITSIGGRVAVPHLLPYDCAKFAVYGLSEGLRAELAKDGVKVTTVVPGLMRTGSPVNAFFKGRDKDEYAWFTLGAATPLSSMNATRAARRIIRALERGEGRIVLTWQAKMLERLHDEMPGVTTKGLGVVNRMLPGGGRADGDDEATKGRDLDEAHGLRPIARLIGKAARRNNEYGDRPPAPDRTRRVRPSPR